MEQSPDMSNTESAEKTEAVDIYWVVANIFAIIHLLEEKFGASAVEQIVMVASNIEASMKQDSQDKG